MINETIEALKDGDTRDQLIYSCHKTLLKKYHQLKDRLPKDEQQDLFNDLILFAYTAADKFDPEKGVKFNTYLNTRFLHFTDNFLTRYTGIKVTRHTMRKYKQEHGKHLTINMEGLPTEDESDA